MQATFARAVVSVALLLTLRVSGLAQGTRADYDRAERLPARFGGKVTHGAVKPNWIGTTGGFWYRIDLGGGRREFVRVDPDAAIRAPAFDHARMATALGAALGKPVQADRLPIDLIDFPVTPRGASSGGARGALRVQSGGRSFLCDLATYTLTPDQASMTKLPTHAPGRGPRASVTTGEETTLTFINDFGAAVDLVWIDADGRHQAYGTLAAGGEREMHTYAGHVWVAAKHDGGAPLAVFTAEARPGIAVVEKPIPAPPPPAAAPEGAGGASNEPLEAIIRDHNVVLRDQKAGTETELTTDGTLADGYEGPAYWSPNREKLVVYKVVPAQEHKVYFVESSPKDRKQPRLHSIDYPKPGDRVAVARPHLFDVHARKDILVARDLFPNPFDISAPRWSPDSTRFTFVYNQRGHQVLRIVGVDAATGAARAIVDERSPTFIDYSGKQFVDYEDPTREILWMSERDGWNHLYLYDERTGTVKNRITTGDWVVRGVDRVDPAKRQVWFRASGVFPGQDPYYVQYGRVNFDGTHLTWLTRADGTHAAAFSPDSRFFVDTYSRVDLPPVSELRRTSDGSLVLPLEKADDSALIAAGWTAPEPFVAKGRDGVTDIYGVVYRPTNFDPTKRYPVIEDIYAGPQDSYVPKAFAPFFGPQQLAELGFVTVQIDGMGTSNRSKPFHDVCWKNLGDGGFPDRIAWMRAAARKYPALDLTRVGIYGVSAGGQNAARAVMTHGDFYRAAVSDSGCHDNRMDKIWWNEQWMGWPVGPEYDTSSNVTAAKDLSGKLMLIVGEMDTNVDPASTMQVVDALIKADKDFDLLVVPGAGHGAGESAYGRRRRADFFVRNLLGVEPRW